MKRVIDDTGKIIPGIYRDVNGMLVVNDSTQFNKYKILKERDETQRATISDLSAKLDELSNMVNSLIKDKINGS